MAFFFFRSSFCGQTYPRWSLWLAVVMVSAPWIAVEMGWIAAEYGRQPWTVDGVLPTALSVSHLTISDVLLTITGFAVFYSIPFVIEMALMLKAIRKGPTDDVDGLKNGTPRIAAALSRPTTTRWSSAMILHEFFSMEFLRVLGGGCCWG